MRHLPGMNMPADADEGATPFAQAVKLIAEANSLDAFRAAAARLEQVAQDGDADAACMLATLAAVGAGRRQDFGRALDQLQLAAERGSDHARDQLRLLAASSGAGEGAGDDWRALRARIDVARLLQVPEREILSESPRLRVYRGFASPAECAWVMERLRPKLGPAMIYDEASGRGEVDPRRSNSAVGVRLTDLDVVIEILRARISAATSVPEFTFEVPQVMHYTVGQEFRPHHDFLDPQKPSLAAEVAQRGQRIMTFLVYLNDDFEGGETEFPSAGIAWRGRTGDGLAFANVTPDDRPDPMSLHAGLPPTSGEKWILSQWIRNRPC